MKFSLTDLRHRIIGEAFDSPEALDYFSTDASIFQQRPQAVVYPRNTEDVSAVVEYLAAMAGGGQKVGLTARGKGTDLGGGAIGSGVIVAFPAHMNQLVRLSRDRVTVQPGMGFKDLQNVLHSHGRFLPPYPSSLDFSSIGGAVANNSAGEKTYKYGSMRDYVEGLKVVLSNGEVIETRRLSARELNRKKGLNSFEGEIYRAVDGLIQDNRALIQSSHPKVRKNSAGYALWRVKQPDGSFDLGQLIIGAQGTLGVVTEATLRTLPFNSQSALLAGYFDNLESAGQAVMKLHALQPSAIEVVDHHLLELVRQTKRTPVEGWLPDPLPAILLLVEFDDVSQLRQNLKVRRAQRLFKRFGASSRVAQNQAEFEQLWDIRRSAAAVIWMTKGHKKALPIIEDATVPVENMPEFLNKLYKLLAKYRLESAVWGHAGDANFHLQPFLDLAKSTDRIKVFKLADDFYDLVFKFGGSTSAEHNDGLMRAPYLKKLYGAEMYGLFEQVKQIFDPQNILNPGKKVGVTRDQVEPLLRREYSLGHLYDHLPYN